MPTALHNPLTYAEPDATADFARALNDPSRWVIRQGVPIFKPHQRTDPNTGKQIVVDVRKLEEIAQNMRKLEQEGGVPARITLGHTQPGAPETRQPPVAGYYRNARVGVFGPKREPAIIADEWLDPQYGAVRKNFPYRSSEYYDDDKHITGVALLARDPYLDLGVVAYSRDCPGPVHYSRAGGSAPYQYVFGEAAVPMPQTPSYQQPTARPEYGYAPPPTAAPYTPPVQPPAAVMYASPQPAPAAHYQGPWPGPAYRKHNIGHTHQSGGAIYGRPQTNRQGPPARYRYGQPRRYAPDDQFGPPGMGGPPMGPPGMGGPPPGGPGMGAPPGMPAGPEDPQAAQGMIVSLLEEVVNLLEQQGGGLPPNDAPADGPFPPGEEDSFDGGSPKGPPEEDEGGEEDDKEDYAYGRRPTGYAPPSRTGTFGGPNGMYEPVSTNYPPAFTPRGGFSPAPMGPRATGSVSGAHDFGVARGGPSAARRAFGMPGGGPSIVGTPSQTPPPPTQNAMYRGQGRPSRYSPPQRPQSSPRYYSREGDTPMSNAPRPAQGRQAQPTYYNAAAQRVNADRVVHEIEKLKRQNAALMYEADERDTEACRAEIRTLAGMGYPVDEFEVFELKKRPKAERGAYLEMIATRYSRVPTDGVAPTPGDPSPHHEAAPQGPARLTREGYDYLQRILEANPGIPYNVALQYARGEAQPTQYGESPVFQAQPVAYGPPAPQPLQYGPAPAPYRPQPAAYPPGIEPGVNGVPYPDVPVPAGFDVPTFAE